MLVPLAVLAFIMIVGGIWLIRQDARRLGAPELITWGALFGLIAIFNGALELMFPTGDIDGWVLVAIVEAASVFIAVFAVWMISAVLSIRGTRSRRPHKMVASLLGIIIVAALVTFHVAFYRVDATLAVALMTVLTPLLVPAATLITLMWWPSAQQRLFAKKSVTPSAIIVLGGGLRRDGTPTDLLARRIEAGIEALRTAPEHAPIVMTGGQGPDEVMPEAESMRNYAIEQNVEAERVVLEADSTSTLTNLRNARGLLVRRDIEKDIVVVTSEYHVPRAANTMRYVPLEGIALPSSTHSMYKPAAYLRETFAILWQRRTLTFVIIGASLLPGVYALFAALG